MATISTGNNGAAVSYAAKLLGIEKAVVICPTTTPKAKLDKIKYYGAQIVQLGENIDRPEPWALLRQRVWDDLYRPLL